MSFFCIWQDLRLSTNNFSTLKSDVDVAANVGVANLSLEVILDKNRLNLLVYALKDNLDVLLFAHRDEVLEVVQTG